MYRNMKYTEATLELNIFIVIMRKWMVLFKAWNVKKGLFSFIIDFILILVYS